MGDGEMKKYAPLMLDIVIPLGFQSKDSDWSADDVRAEMGLRMAREVAAMPLRIFRRCRPRRPSLHWPDVKALPSWLCDWATGGGKSFYQDRPERAF